MYHFFFTNKLNFTNDISFINWTLPKEKLMKDIYKETIKLQLGEYGIVIIDD